MQESKARSSLRKEQLPTMYDLPSEEIGDSGLPDQYHFWQGELLSETFVPPNYPSNQVLVACDLNLYYNPSEPLWYKRPDWMAVVGVDRFYRKTEPRLSYVIWQEEVKPFIIVELLSPSTEKEDLGLSKSESGKTPLKWQVYEKILKIPYYVVFDGRRNHLRLFKLTRGSYQLQEVGNGEYWFKEIELGLKLVFGKYQGLNRIWLRWCDRLGNLIPTPTEREKQRADLAELENARLKELLRQAGINLNED
jgi:Uma2 family endonuclease